jgi:H+/Cl- antiporter ClcA
VLFAWLAEAADGGYRALVARWPLAPFLLTPIGFAVAAALTGAFFDGAQGSGIPQVIAARASSVPAHRTALLGWRVTVAKIVLTAFCMLAGGSIGREGPTVQVGAAIMFAAGGLAGIGRQRGLVLAGAAAGIAAAFNAPLAGILFVIEELARSFDRRLTAITVAAVILAGPDEPRPRRGRELSR